MKNYYLKLVVVFLWTTFSSILHAQDPNFYIYLVFGQSNMEGSGAIESQDKTGVDARFKVISAVNCTGNRTHTLGKWSTATPPLVRCYSGLGISDYFGRTMVKELSSEIRIGIVPVAIGGCDIVLFDKVNYASYVATAPSWMKDAINQYGGNPYARLVEVAKLAQKDGVIKGILFHQGETNTNNPEWKNKVANVVKDLKTDLGLDDIPFLAGELLSTPDACCSSHNVEVNKLPDLIPNAYVISSEGLEGADGAHFTSASYRTFGARYAEKIIEVLDPNPVTAIEHHTPENAITIYPIPTWNGFFTINNIRQIVHIELLTMMGKKIARFDNNNQSDAIDIRVETNTGVLLLKLSDGKTEFYKKVIIN